MAEQPEQREITVLVKFQTTSGTSRNRPVIFSGSKIDLVRQTRHTFSDIVVAEDSDIYFQLEDQTWGPGVLVDLLDQEVEDRSILIAFEKVFSLISMCIIILHHGYIYYCTLVVQRLESGCARLGHGVVLCIYVNLKKFCLRSLVYRMQVVSVTVS